MSKVTQICGLFLIKFEIHQFLQGDVGTSASVGYVS